jgi:hypothetical protein
MSVAFVREESAAAAQEVSLPPRAISAHPNLVTQSGLRARERALADSQQALKAAQALLDANERRRALDSFDHRACARPAYPRDRTRSPSSVPPRSMRARGQAVSGRVKSDRLKWADSDCRPPIAWPLTALISSTFSAKNASADTVPLPT